MMEAKATATPTAQRQIKIVKNRTLLKNSANFVNKYSSVFNGKITPIIPFVEMIDG